MRRGFTLTELLIVITVIAVLMGLLFPAIGMIKREAKTVQCSNNLRQIALGLEVYRQQYNDQFPDRLSRLVVEGFDKKSFICPFDNSHGTDPSFGRNSGWGAPYDYLHEQDAASDPYTGCRLYNCSYMYEVSSQKDPANPGDNLLKDPGNIAWFYVDYNETTPPTPMPTVGSVSWSDAKAHQLKFGNKDPVTGKHGLPFSAAGMPIVRCFYHFAWNTVTPDQALGIKKVNNVSFDFNIFWSNPTWEHDQTPSITPSSE
jgi:prepilin-type N-terminal cleavage/methylation domain-containing protein